MAFWKSEDEKKREIEEVKKQVQGKRERREPSRPERGQEQGTRLPTPPQPPAADKKANMDLPDSPEDFEEPSVRIEEDKKPPQKPEPKEKPPEVKRKPPEREPEIKRKPPEKEPEGDSAPLFVKIDRYERVLQDLEEVKGSLDDLRNLFDLMDEVDSIKRRGMEELRSGIAQLADTLVSMDGKFIRPEGVGESVDEPESRVSKTVRELHEDLKEIRNSLGRIE